MIKKVLIPIIAGNEEIETSCIYSILSRAGKRIIAGALYILFII